MRLAAELPSGRGASLVRRVVRAALRVVDADLVVSLLILTGPQGPFSRRGQSLRLRGRRGLSTTKVKRTPGVVDLGPLEPRLPGILRTAGKVVRVAPAPLLASLRALGSEEPSSDTPFDLQLIGRRHLRSNNSWFHNVPAMVKGRDRCTALMHPGDASSRGLLDGQQVTI